LAFFARAAFFVDFSNSLARVAFLRRSFLPARQTYHNFDHARRTIRSRTATIDIEASQRLHLQHSPQTMVGIFSLYETFKRELEDDESPMKDVALVGSDGGRVKAAKNILAMHSPFFRHMFFGNFKEASCDSVTLSYPSEILRWVVTFCYIGEWPKETFWDEDKSGFFLGARSDNEAQARLLVRLRDASDYFELTLLHCEISLVLKSPPLYIDCFKISFVVMDELRSLGETDGDLWSKCEKNKARLTNICFVFQCYSLVFHDFRVWGTADGYEWTARFGKEVLELAARFSHQVDDWAHGSVAAFVHSAEDNFKTLQSQGEIDKELWSNTFDKARNNAEAFLQIMSAIDGNVNLESRRSYYLGEYLEKREPPSGLHFVVVMRVFKKMFDPVTRDEEEILHKHRDRCVRALHLLPKSSFKCIKPCSIFTRKLLDDVSMSREQFSDDEDSSSSHSDDGSSHDFDY